jgi:hypothetical protein
MKKQFYIPVLKSKQGEFDALFKLDSKIKEYTVPLFEITPIEYDNSIAVKPKTIETHLTNFCNKVEKKWSLNELFVDTHLIPDERPSGKDSFEYIFDILFEKNIIPIPVVRIDSPINLIKSINILFLLYPLSQIAIRITISDLLNIEIESEIETLLNSLSIDPQNCHLIIDLKDSDFTNYEDFSDGILDSLKEFPKLKSWNTISICGAAFPPTNLLEKGLSTIPRNDWKFYTSLIDKIDLQKLDIQINFGDYGIVASGYFEFDPRKMSRSANIRYTHNNVWFISKGSKLKKSEDFKQYLAQTQEIVKSKYYLGETFSAGDTHIKKCAEGIVSTGNPTVWNWVGNNHHFTKVVSDLVANNFFF